MKVELNDYELALIEAGLNNLLYALDDDQRNAYEACWNLLGRIRTSRCELDDIRHLDFEASKAAAAEDGDPVELVEAELMEVFAPPK